MDICKAAAEMERIQTDADELVSGAIKQSEETATASEREKILALQKDFAMKMSFRWSFEVDDAYYCYVDFCPHVGKNSHSVPTMVQ